MKDLFGKILKKEPKFNELLAAYHPAEVDLTNLKKDNTQSEYEYPTSSDTDEMQIDRIYQSL